MIPYHKAIIRWLRDSGATEVRIDLGGHRKHPRLEFAFGDERHACPIAGSPSDWRSERAMISQLRHMLGMVGGAKIVGERRRRHRAPTQRPDPLPQFTGEGRVSRSAGLATLADVWPRAAQR